jgi:hypothetical protein
VFGFPPLQSSLFLTVWFRRRSHLSPVVKVDEKAKVDDRVLRFEISGIEIRREDEDEYGVEFDEGKM